MKAKFLPVLITRCGIPVIEAREQACISRASLVFSTALPVPSFSTTTFLPRPLWLWPHLLSLEAPLVAVAWTWGLAKLHQMSIMPGVLPGLGLCVWIVYVLDRVLDGIHHSLRRHVQCIAIQWPGCEVTQVYRRADPHPHRLSRQ